MADPIYAGRIQITRPSGYPGADAGGPFRITVVGGGPAGGIWTAGFSYLTFCIEADEYISLGGSNYYYAFLNSGSVYGGMNPGTFDPVADVTALIYSDWASGNLPALTGSPSPERIAQAVQRVIWYFEQEYGTANSTASGLTVGSWTIGSPERQLAAFYLGVPSSPTSYPHGSPSADYWPDLGLIGTTGSPLRAVNLWTGFNDNSGVITPRGTASQDQLAPAPVPEPTTLALLGFGLVLVGIASRRSKS